MGALGEVAATIDTSAWARNRLVGPDDGLLEAYRKAMHNLHPDVLDYFAGAR